MVTEQQAADLVATIFQATRMLVSDPAERQARRKAFGLELMRVARSLEHAEQIAARCRSSFDDFPTIHQLHEIATATAMEEPAPVNLGSPDCARCHGSGWAPGQVERNGMRYSCVARCACRKAPEVHPEAAGRTGAKSAPGLAGSREVRS
jgi:hypothetical protein